ncbi:MAG TPA: 2-dehydropantoate 2-reductase [Kofleriaceae bacterium]|jgi:2-dehydropantoate 2-reductase
MPTSDILIVGAGALGSLLGARLAGAGVSVRLVARGAHAEAIRKDGLLFRRPGADARVNVDVLDHPERRDGTIVFLTSKAPDVAAIASDLAARCGDDVPTVCWQNGVRSEADASAALRSVYGATTSSNASVPTPGVVVEARLLPCAIGRYPNGDDTMCSSVVELLVRAGLPAVVEPDIIAVKWSKIFGSVFGAVVAVVDKPPSDPEMRPFLIELLVETLTCVRAAGITLKPVPGQPDPEAWIAQLRAGGGPAPATSTDETFRIRTSTWQDLTQRRPRNEGDFLNGAVVELAARHGVAAPLNRAVQQALADLAAKELGPGAYTVGDLRRLATMFR